LLRSALEVVQRSRDDYTVAAIQNDLGTLYQSEERLNEAEQAYRNALSIFRRIPDKNYDTAVVLRNLGSVYSLDRRDSEAFKVLHEASKLIKKDTPIEQELSAQILNCLGLVYFRQGKFGRAETLLAQAIGIQSVTDDLDLDDAQILTNLGSIYERQHKYGKAEESYKRSLEIAERRLGPLHPDLTVTLGNLGILYTEMRRYSEAKDQYRRSLTILEQTRPTLDGRIVWTLHWLSKTYIQEGNQSSAESVLAQAVGIARRDPAPNPELPLLLDAYADTLKSLGKLQEALTLHAEARRTRAAMALTVRPRKPD
jgi:tetratricopeptide (TPR) repeat protein